MDRRISAGIGYEDLATPRFESAGQRASFCVAFATGFRVESWPSGRCGNCDSAPCDGLPGYELDERSDDAVEPVVQARIWLNVAAHDGDFETRECFTG